MSIFHYSVNGDVALSMLPLSTFAGAAKALSFLKPTRAIICEQLLSLFYWPDYLNGKAAAVLQWDVLYNADEA